MAALMLPVLNNLPIKLMNPTVCPCRANRATPSARLSLAARLGKGFAWLLPTTILILLPKCPVCLAAYIALGTGIGMTAASHLYITAIVLCVFSLLWLATRQCRKWKAASRATSHTSLDSL